MTGKTRIFTTPLIFAFFALVLPMVVGFMKEDSRPDLTGIVISDEKPELNRSSWFSGEYQNARDSYNDDHWAFKEKMVRLNNQFYYDAFNQIRVKSFVAGKEDYLFSEGYIFSAFGDDLMPEKKVRDLLYKAKVVQDTLKKKGIDLLLVFAPGKGAGCREFVEDKYVHPFTNTNHLQYADISKQLGVNFLDLYGWFDLIKEQSPYPLFPRFGHHWSYYGECLAVDTIVQHIEHLHGADLPDFRWQDIEVADTARFRDADVLKSMNLLNNPDQRMKLAYPVIEFENDAEKNQTRVLTVSDSYWYGPVYMGVPPRCFAGGQFWYYFNKVIPSPIAGQKVEVWELDLKKEIESNNVIMLLYSDGNLPVFGSGFIEEAYEMYTSPETYYERNAREKVINAFAKQIREAPGLLKRVTTASNEMRIPLDSAIKLEAARMAGLN